MSETYTTYCPVCRLQRTFEGEIRVGTRREAVGLCPVCGTTLHRVLPAP